MWHDIRDDISGLIPTGSMLIVVIVEYAMSIILVTETINCANLMSSSSKNEIFFPQIQYFHTATAKSRVENISHRQHNKIKFIWFPQLLFTYNSKYYSSSILLWQQCYNTYIYLIFTCYGNH